VLENGGKLFIAANLRKARHSAIHARIGKQDI
jgi:hypothetical protein